MMWKDVRKEFGRGIDRVDRLGYNNVYLIGIIINKHDDKKRQMVFVISENHQYQKFLEQRYNSNNEGKLVFATGTKLIRK